MLLVLLVVALLMLVLLVLLVVLPLLVLALCRRYCCRICSAQCSLSERVSVSMAQGSAALQAQVTLLQDQLRQVRSPQSLFVCHSLVRVCVVDADRGSINCR